VSLRTAHSTVLIVSTLQPFEDLCIHIYGRLQTDLQMHVVVNFGWKQPTLRLDAIQAQSKVNPLFRGWLYTCERAAGGDQCHEGFAGLDREWTQPRRRCKNGVKNRTEMRSVGVLSIDQFIRRGLQEILAGFSIFIVHDLEPLSG
jgi:hypothetical protein